MVRFLFWNIKRRPLQDRLANLVRYHDVDVIMLVECMLPPEDLLFAVNAAASSEYQETMTLLDTIAVYSRLPKRSVETLEDNPDMRVTIRRVEVPAGKELLLVVAHFPSKLFWSDVSQNQPCIQLARTVRRWEERLGHSRTVVVGDLNMNPFEAGIVASYGLHATMARDVALRETRTIQGEDYSFFYNPMWGCFGDALDGPPGTYYDTRAEAVNYFWNIFDQVLIRPSLVGAFRNDSLRILSSDGANSLATSHGFPDGRSASDHFPILFDLDV